MAWIIDLIIVAIVLLSVIIVAKKGFVKTVFNIVGFVAAIVVALMLCGPVADFVYDEWVGPTVKESVESLVDKKMDEKGADINKKIEESSLPQFVKSKLSDVDLNSYGDKSDEIADAICSKVVRPVTVGFIKAISFLVMFIILSILAKILANAINKAFSFSVVGKANKFFGGVLGLVYGVALAALFVVVLKVAISLTGGFAGIDEQTLQSTFIIKNVMAYLPFNTEI